MRKLLYIATLLLFIGSTGCNRRPLKDEGGNIAKVPVQIDWSKSNLDIENISRVTVRVFPHDGSPAYDFVMQESKTTDILPLAVGKYSLVIFNETTDPNDWKALTFAGADKYETFVVNTSEDAFRGLYSKADGNVIRKLPDALAAWSIDEFDVTPAMVGAALSNVSISVAPVPVVKHIKILARVVNLVSAKKSSGAINGASGGIQLSTRKPTNELVTHIFIMNGRQYDDPAAPKDGTIGASIVLFDASSLENLQSKLLIDFLLHDETSVPTEVFDIASELKSDKPVIEISVGFGDRKIILPAFPIGGQGVGVDEWDEIITPLE